MLWVYCKKKNHQAPPQVQPYQGLLLRNPFTGNSKQSSAFAAGELTVAAILLECYKCETQGTTWIYRGLFVNFPLIFGGRLCDLYRAWKAQLFLFYEDSVL